MEARRRTWFDDRGLVVAVDDAPGGRTRSVPFYAGAMHYWRVPADRWAACLRQIHAQGLTLVETYVPWRVHEPERGVYDWKGARGQLDLPRFLELAQAEGLGVVLRPGPHVNAELTAFGFPDHVLLDEECLARTSRGTPAWMPSPPRAWPIPSYASKVFQARVREWYAAVFAVVEPYLAGPPPKPATTTSTGVTPSTTGATTSAGTVGATTSTTGATTSTTGASTVGATTSTMGATTSTTGATTSTTGATRGTGVAGTSTSRGSSSGGGPVVAIGVDNEAQMFFRTGAYDLDYHPDAIAWWREAHEQDPPRALDTNDIASCVAWVRFKDQYIARALGAFADSLDAVGFAGIARFHNLPPGHYGHYDLRGIQDAIGPVGIDAYTARAGFRDLRRRGTALVGNARPVPIAFEVGIGFFPWFPPLDEPGVGDPQRERDHLLTLLAAGARGFNLFMAVERDRYYGAAISIDGQLESHASWIAPLVRTLGELEWPTLRRHAAIALVHTRADARFGDATNLLDPVTPVLTEILDLGPAGAAELGFDDGALDARRWHDAVAAALELGQIPYAIVDESASEDELASYRAVIVPTGNRVDRALWQRLRSLAESKRAVVVIGPGTPTRDELDRPLADPAPRRVGRLRAGSLDDLAGLAEDLAGLAGDPVDAWIVERPDAVRAAAFVDGTGKTRVVFVTSDAPKSVTAIVLGGEGAKALRDPFSDERFAIAAGKATIPLAPRGVRMLVVE